MPSLDPIPQARVVRKGKLLFAPPPRPRSEPPSALVEQLRTALAVAVGLWPLTAVLLLMIGLLYMAGHAGAP